MKSNNSKIGKKSRSLRWLGLATAALALLWAGYVQASADNSPKPELIKHESHSTADHSKFKELQRDFASGPEVTEACLSCHTEASHQVKKSIHWSWTYTHPETGQELGKKNVFNSFCGNVSSNEPRCTSCHVGYGWEDMNQPPPSEDAKVDCVVCHDMTGTYSKWPTHAGHPLYEPLTKKGKTIQPPDLTEVAQNVGLPERNNCGACHFFGGGGDNVKHGDLSTALIAPDKHVDVHMDKDGLNFACTECHISEEHMVVGSRYDVQTTSPEGGYRPGQRRDVASCESCHGSEPHEANTVQHMKLNNHTDTVACQTCHIPEFAKGGVATKTFWDWSAVGKLKDGKPFTVDGYTQGDGKVLHTYMSKKGDFKYGEDVVPHYGWFDGQVEYTLQANKIDPTQIVEVNKISGSADDPDSKIWPFKRMEGRQAYDKVSSTLVATNVWGPKTDTAYWTNFDWTKAITAGMDSIGVPFSGEHGFVDTYMYWPITHMVSPKEEALACAECHSKEGRLKDVEGVYMPGQYKNSWLDILGLLAVAFAIIGVLGHGLVRILANKGGKQA